MGGRTRWTYGDEGLHDDRDRRGRNVARRPEREDQLLFDMMDVQRQEDYMQKHQKPMEKETRHGRSCRPVRFQPQGLGEPRGTRHRRNGSPQGNFAW